MILDNTSSKISLSRLGTLGMVSLILIVKGCNYIVGNVIISSCRLVGMLVRSNRQKSKLYLRLASSPT